MAESASLVRFLSHVGGGSRRRLGVLITRPGSGPPDTGDRARADAVYGAWRDAEVSCETVHVATATVITPLPMDDPRVSACCQGRLEPSERAPPTGQAQ